MRRQAGFGLIEVMLAFIIVAVTSGALLQLNKVYLEYSRDGAYREVAIRLAESRLDEFRTFSSEAEYAAVTSGTELITAHNGMSYEVSWDINELVHRKDVVITVSWNDPGGTKSLVMESTIAPNLSVASGPFGTADDNPGISMSGPEVSYSPGAIPDIVSITTDPGSGTKQETTKPAPDVKKNSDDVVVSFDSIIYNSASNRLIQSDTRTLYCNCTYQSGNELRRKPSTPYQLADGVYWLAGGLAEKPWGDSDNPDCKTCCNDHFDAGSAFEDIYNQFNPGHGHYRNGTQVSTGESYFESCRMLRIDGFYRVMPDWNLIALNLFPPSYLADASNVQLYQAYIKDVVQEYISIQKSAIPDANYKSEGFRDWLNVHGDEAKQEAFDNLTELFIASYQLVARAIYVDLMPQGLLDAIDFNDANWLTKVSFNEVNVTLLANWAVKDGDNTYLVVTNEPVETTVDRGKNLFGTYSRGYVTTRQESSTVNPQPKVYASMTRYNSGLTGQEPISPFDAGSVFETSLTLSVSSGSPTTTFISGKLECLTRQGQGTTPVACKSQDFNTVATPDGGSNNSCTIRKDSDPATAFYECTVTAGQAVTITFTNNQPSSDFVFNPSSVILTSDQVDNNTDIPCVIQINNNITNFVTYSCQP
jgi:type II secretory pathway pseudopilin PulG